MSKSKALRYVFLSFITLGFGFKSMSRSHVNGMESGCKFEFYRVYGAFNEFIRIFEIKCFPWTFT